MKFGMMQQDFFSNKSSFEYKIRKLEALSTPIAKLTATHNTSAASKRDSQEANGLMAQLYLAVGAEVMLTSNLWTEVGLHNGAKGKVVDIVYKNAAGPRINNGKNLPEAIVIELHKLADEVESFFEGQEKL